MFFIVTFAVTPVTANVFLEGIKMFGCHVFNVDYFSLEKKFVELHYIWIFICIFAPLLVGRDASGQRS